MHDLLLLMHRIPYPPNKGDKIRSYHLLRYLSQRYRVHLATFVDDPADWQHVSMVQELCASCYFAPLRPLAARLRSLGALVHNRALSLDYYRDRGLATWVKACVQRHRPARVVVFSSPMAQFGLLDEARVVIDFCDVDSEKWRQYAERKSWPANLLYRYEADRLRRYERASACQADAALFVSAPEAALFREIVPQAAAHTNFFSNGVDTQFFAPEQAGISPYSADETPLVFCGAMDYWPNIDAVQWFANQILPEIQLSIPSASFYIVGARPTQEVRRLGERARVHVTGTLPDVRPHVAHAALSVAPLRLARGIQNKVLEAMAMGKAVVATSAALEGIDAQPGVHLLVADQSGDISQAVLRLLRHGPGEERHALGAAARALVEATYGWDARLAPLAALLEAPLQRRVDT